MLIDDGHRGSVQAEADNLVAAYDAAYALGLKDADILGELDESGEAW
jgi:hypothetical protein